MGSAGSARLTKTTRPSGASCARWLGAEVGAPLSSEQFWAEQARMGVEPCCLFDLPGVGLHMVCIDTLHALDIGFTQYLIGNLLWEFQASGLCRGHNIAERVEDLWLKLKAHYKAFATPNQIQTLTPPMLRKDGQPPKLRTKGADTRHIVPFGLACAQAMHAASPTPHNDSVLRCISYLMQSLPPHDHGALEA